MLPLHYPDPQHLPFNRFAMGDFRLQPSDRDPGGAGLWLAMQGTHVLVTTTPGVQLPKEPPGDLLEESLHALYFGTLNDIPCRTLKLPRDYAPPEGFALENLLAPEPQLDIAELSLAGVASQVLHWERESHHCGRCGESCSFLPGEWGRICSSCQMHRYPAVHPCVIVLISRPGEVLLVRKAEWAENRYSLVAGFVEFGESLEDCVEREVEEEVGVKVTNVRYAGSQGWPFPSQLMAGYFAEYVEGELKLDTDELEDGGWFPIDQLPNLPPRRSIARWLIDRWKAEEKGKS